LTLLFILTASGRAADTDPKKEPASYLKVEAKGKLRTGLVAIGGETTGSLINTPGGTFEGELPPKTDAEKLPNKAVNLAGTMDQLKGVTRPGMRTIIKVETLKEVK